ncbi:MAG: hypothetical protein ACM3N5_16530 [Candidatus Eiseniibacteriota bacterium]
MLRISAIAGAIVASSAFAAAANAADVPPCGPRDQIVQAMKQIFDERPQATGLLSSKELFEVFVSPTGSWTILVTNPHGISCIAAAGDNWERSPGQIADRMSSMD